MRRWFWVVLLLSGCGVVKGGEPPGADDPSAGGATGGAGQVVVDAGTFPGGPAVGDGDGGATQELDGGVLPPDGGQAVSDGGTQMGDGGTAGDAGSVSLDMSFFVTSRGGGKGGDLRRTAEDVDGLAGADELCKALAGAVSPALGEKRWRAYLSTSSVNARDRIGAGPWKNAKGAVIARDVAELHEEGGLKNAIAADTALDERGAIVPREAHDILTGSDEAGRAAANLHCNDWTSAGGGSSARVGHVDRMGNNLTSWNSAHDTAGCTENGANSVRARGGRGSIYCFVGP